MLHFESKVGTFHNIIVTGESVLDICVSGSVSLGLFLAAFQFNVFSKSVMLKEKKKQETFSFQMTQKPVSSNW